MFAFHLSRVSRRSLIALTALLALVSSRPLAAASAASAAPTLIGTVVDSAGTPIPNATVLVAEVSRTTTTDARGGFVLRGLPPGEYHLSVISIGFAPGHAVAVLPSADEEVRVTIRLYRSPLRLNAVVVSATPTGTESDRLTQAALELSGQALSRAVGSTVAASLASEPGVSQRFAGPAASMPVIRGLTGDRILVLQDGERTGDLASSASDHAVSADPLAAQRIEVVRGPASLLYGNNALGGVVNVVSNDIPTVVPSHVEGFVGTQAETVTPGGAISAGATFATGARGALSVRGGFRDLGSLRTGGGTRLFGTDSRAAHATLGYGVMGERGTFGVAVRAYDFDYGIPAEAGDPEAGVSIDGRRLGASARGSLQTGNLWVPYLKVEASAQDYTHDEIEPDGAVGTNFALGTQTVNAQATTWIGDWKGAIGVQGLFKQYAATGDEALTPHANSAGGGIFLFQERPLHARDEHEHVALIQLGARWDSYSVASKAGDPKFGPATTSTFGAMSGSVGLSVPAGEKVTISGSLARAFRAPTVEELHSNGLHAATGTYDVGDPDLGEETSLGAEVIVRVRSSRVSAQLAAYSNAVADYVTTTQLADTVVDSDTVPMFRFTQDDATLRGLEGSIEAHVSDAVVVSAMGDLVRGEFDAGGALPFMPPARVGAGVRWERGGRFVSLDAKHGFAQDRVTGGDDLATDAYTVVNWSVGRQWIVGNILHRVTLRVDNVGDVRYFDAASRIKRFAANPGRNTTLLYQVQF